MLRSCPLEFKGLAIIPGALPPDILIEQALRAISEDWLMPRLFIDELKNEVVGSGGFKSAPLARSVEIGYGVAASRRNQGFASQAVLLLVREAFASGRIDEVRAETIVDNHASSRVLLKCGFRLVGTRRSPGGLLNLWGLRNP